jgi:hypothetical protein
VPKILLPSGIHVLNGLDLTEEKEGEKLWMRLLLNVGLFQELEGSAGKRDELLALNSLKSKFGYLHCLACWQYPE